MSEIFRVRQSISEIRVDSQKAQSDAKQAIDSAQSAATSHAELLVSLDNKVDGATRQVMDGLDTFSSSARSVETSVMSIRDTGEQILRCIQSFPCEIRDLLQKILRTNLHLYWMLTRIQSNLPKSPTTVLESNIIFEDAMGRVQGLPYQWFQHWETFEGMLRAEFKGIPGGSKVLDGSYHLLDNNNPGRLICKENWAHAVIPGSTVMIFMLMTELRWRRGQCPRPSCQKVTPSSATSNSTIICTNCGLKYSLIRDPIPEERKIVEIEDEETYISQMQVEEDIRVFGDRPIPPDLDETDNSIMALGGSTSDSPDLARLASLDHLSNAMDFVEPTDGKGIKELRIVQDSSGSLDQFTDEKEMLDSLQAKKRTPLDAWLSKIPAVGTASYNIPTVPRLDSEGLEAKGIEKFRNVHVKDVESIGQIHSTNSERACTDNPQEIIFSARIFYRNIRDRYPQMPKFLARRLAKANLARSDRLGFSRVEQGESSSEEDFEHENSWASVLDSGKVKPEASPEKMDPEALGESLISSTEYVSLDAIPVIPAMEGVGSVKFGTLGQKEHHAERSMSSDKEKTNRDISYWSEKIRVPSPHSSASGSSMMNSSLHGSEEDGKMSSPTPRSSSTGTSSRFRSIGTSTGKSSRSGSIYDYQELVLELPPPPIELGTQQSFACDICGCTVNVLRKRDWTKHVFQDLEPYMCTYEDCRIGDRTYATRNAFLRHEIEHHREVFREFGCNYCNEKFDRKRDVRKHLRSDKCSRSTILDISSKLGFHIIQEQITESICPFCATEITGDYGNLTQHLGKHMEEVSFAVVRKPYEEWQFYEDSVSANTQVPSVMLKEDIFEATLRSDVEKVVNLLNAGANVNTERNGESLLHVASAKGCDAIVSHLLQRDADHQKKSEPKTVENLSVSSKHQLDGTESRKEGRTALGEASIRGHVKVAAMLAETASDEGFRTSIEDALLLAAEFGQLSIIEKLVRCLKSVTDDCLRASLHFAAKEGHINVMRFMLFSGARTIQAMHLRLSRPKWLNPTDPETSRWHDLMDPLLAAFQGNHKTIALLLLKGGPPISKSTWYKCALNEDRELVSALIRNETASSAFHQYPLIEAIEDGYMEIADILVKNAYGMTYRTITSVCMKGQSSILSHVLDHGAVPDSSHLRYAMQNGDPDTIKLLLLRHPKLLYEIYFESISLSLVSGFVGTVKIFLPLGRAYRGPEYLLYGFKNTALDPHAKIVKLLISKGFDVNVGDGYVELKLLLDAGVNDTSSPTTDTSKDSVKTQAFFNTLIEKSSVWPVHVTRKDG